MNPRQLFGAMAWVLAAFFAAAPLGALAVTSSYGANYSYNTSNFKTMYVCDAEGDGDNAYTIFNSVSSGTGIRQTDSNGSASGCGTRTVYSVITGHQTCEDHNWAPDPCGYWKYTS